MRPLRVALLAWDWSDAPTGLGRAAREIAAGLAGAGARVAVATADRPAGTHDAEDGVELVGCAPGPALARLRRWAAVGHLAAPAAFRRAVRRIGATGGLDVIEATNWYAPAALLAGGTEALVVRCSTPALETSLAGHPVRDRIDLAAAHRLEARTVRAAAGVIANTGTHAERIRDWYRLDPERRIDVIGLSLAADTIARGARAGGPPVGRPARLLFVGRAERRKGFAEALGALAILTARASADTGPVCTLDVVGMDADALRTAVTEAGLSPDVLAGVAAHGRADDERLHRLYETASLVLAPSRYESYGLVYREAAAFGRPLVASAEDPSARAFVGASGAGVLARATEPRAIAEAVRAVLACPRWMAEMGARGRAHAAALGREALGAATLGVYERAIELNRARRS